MEPIQIQATVVVAISGKINGEYKWAEEYVPEITITEYIDHFENLMYKNNSRAHSKVILLQVSEHDVRGDYVFDEDGVRKYNVLYKALD